MTKQYKEKDYGVSTQLIKEYGSLQRVLESREEIEKFRARSEKMFEETIALILEAPRNTMNWEHNIAMLIGTARAHKMNRDNYTIKEK